MTTQTRLACELDPADARRFAAQSADHPAGVAGCVRLAVLQWIRERERVRPVARLKTEETKPCE